MIYTGMAATTEEVNYKSPPLPPYPEMIVAALEALKEEGGSNKSSISKYIESRYGDLPGGHSQLLSDYLNKMKDSGELVFWKNNYIKSDQAPPRRGRGRPPKSSKKPSPADLLQPSSPRGRGRGRPPKTTSAPKPPADKPPKVSSGRPRGRPRKMSKPSGGLTGSDQETETPPVTVGRPRGRPPKVKPPAAAAEIVMEMQSGL